jgi:hypothetical protein
MTDQRSDLFSRLAVQIIFCFRSRFYDFEKPVGQEQGRAVYASVYGFTSDRVSEMDAASRHGNWTNPSFGLSELMTNSVFVLGSTNKNLERIPALAATPDSSVSGLEPKSESNDNHFGSERRHHLQLSTLVPTKSPILQSLTKKPNGAGDPSVSLSGNRILQQFDHSDIDSDAGSAEPILGFGSTVVEINVHSDSLTPPRDSPKGASPRDQKY